MKKFIFLLLICLTVLAIASAKYYVEICAVQVDHERVEVERARVQLDILRSLPNPPRLEEKQPQVVPPAAIQKPKA